MYHWKIINYKIKTIAFTFQKSIWQDIWKRKRHLQGSFYFVEGCPAALLKLEFYRFFLTYVIKTDFLITVIDIKGSTNSNSTENKTTLILLINIIH